MMNINVCQIAFEIRNNQASRAHSAISGDSAMGDIGLEERLVFFPELRLRCSFFGFGWAKSGCRGIATAGRGMSLGGAGASWRKGASPSSKSSRKRSASLMKALGAPVVYCERAGPVGQLGKAQAILLLEDAEMFRAGEDSDRAEGEGQPIEMGDEEADELGEYE